MKLEIRKMPEESNVREMFHKPSIEPSKTKVLSGSLCVKRVVVATAFLWMGASGVSAETLDQKVNKLVGQMTLDEKLDMIHGDGFNIAPVKRLGILPINMSDASMGLRVTPWPSCKGLEPSTAFPASLLLAATWDTNAVYRYATAVAEEFRARNMHVLLGPGVNIYRNPLCGRNYEYMGEDPYLVSRMVVAYVRAVRDVGCISVVKHLVANQSEPMRKASNSVVSERALREIYFPAFKAAVKEGGTLGIMNAYNLLNGTYCGENKWLLKDVLRGEWGFRGMVVSDWQSLWHPELAANSGVDIEMPGGNQTFAMAPDTMKRLLAKGKTTPAEIDSKVSHLIRAPLQMGMYSTNWARPALNKLDEHAEVALDTARKGMVLLQNRDGFLPLEPGRVRRIVVIGPTARETPTTGGGSGGVRPENPVSIWDAVKDIYGDKAELLDAFDASEVAAADAVLVCVGYNTGQVLKDPRKKGSPRSIAAEQAAFNKASKSGWAKDNSEHEGADRPGFSLPTGDNELIAQCAEANPNTAVLYVAGGGIAMPWADKVKSILWMVYPGQNGCIAAAEIVAGKTNPSGKLPITIEKRLEDNAAYAHLGLKWGLKAEDAEKGPAIEHWNIPYHKGPPAPGTEPLLHWNVEYAEGVFVGYRHMDQEKIAPRFPFGHGLSYTTFRYGNLKIRKTGKNRFRVGFTLTNTGKRDGYETAQLYVADEKSSVPRPPKELKGFCKVFLRAGETKKVEIDLDPSAFAFWHPKKKKWVVEPGRFHLLLGSSSRDIRLRAPLVLK